MNCDAIVLFNWGKHEKKSMNILSKNVDKVLHFLVTYAVTMSFTAYGYWLAGVVLSAILSIAKELLDQYVYKGFR